MGHEGLELGKVVTNGKAAAAGVGLPGASSRRRKHSRLTTCCGACCLILILILVVFIILAFTVFKPKNPKIHVDNLTLDSFQLRIVLNLPPTLSLNATLGIAISIHNPNRASVKYTNSTSYMFYRNVEVGFIPIPAGHLGAHGTQQISSDLNLMADRVITNSHLLGDVNNGSLPFSTTTRISGRVNVFNIYKHHISASSVCSFSVSTTNRSITDMVCAYDLDL